jgi:hypothetical protein
MALIEARPEIYLRGIDVAEAARGEETTQRLGKVQILLQTRDGGRVRPLRNDPAMLRAYARGGCCHVA